MGKTLKRVYLCLINEIGLSVNFKGAVSQTLSEKRIFDWFNYCSLNLREYYQFFYSKQQSL